MKETVDFCERLRTAATNRADVTLWGVDYTPLPLDAEGAPIRVGDKVVLPNGKHDAIRFMTLNGSGWLLNEAGWLPCAIDRHAPTVEDVLLEFVNIYDDAEGIDARASVMAEFAAKLRLVGEE